MNEFVLTVSTFAEINWVGASQTKSVLLKDVESWLHLNLNQCVWLVNRRLVTSVALI